MANISLGSGGTYAHLNDWWPDAFTAMTHVSETSTKAVYKDDGGNRIILEGTGFNKSGDVSDVTVLRSDGSTVLTAHDVGMSFDDIDAVITSSWSVDVVAKITSGDDTITGTNAGEELMVASNAGDDTLLGKGGDDFFRGGPGDNTMDGGKGYDVLSYHTDWWSDYQPKHGIDLDTAAGTVVNPWSGKDQISSFEKYQGTSFKDRMSGSASAETFSGFDSSDTIDGRGGIDTVAYDSDVKYGGNGGINADLQKGKVVDGFGKTDIITDVENVVGTQFADTIKGSAAKNTLDGREGSDVLTGAGGGDTFVFATGYRKDEISDFGNGADRIDIRNWAGIDSLADVKAHVVDGHGDDLWIVYKGDTLILDHTQLSDLGKQDFQFA